VGSRKAEFGSSDLTPAPTAKLHEPKREREDVFDIRTQVFPTSSVTFLNIRHQIGHPNQPLFSMFLPIKDM
jgi:hypothetical protein